MTKQATLSLREKLDATTPELAELESQLTHLRGYLQTLRGIPAPLIPGADDFADYTGELPDIGELAVQQVQRDIGDRIAAGITLAINQVIPFRRLEAIRSSLPDRVAVLQTEINRLHGEAVAALAEMGDVVTADEAIGSKVTDQWSRVAEIAEDLRSIRKEQIDLAEVAGLTRGPGVVAALLPNLGMWVAEYAAARGVDPRNTIRPVIGGTPESPEIDSRFVRVWASRDVEELQLDPETGLGFVEPVKPVFTAIYETRTVPVPRGMSS